MHLVPASHRRLCPSRGQLPLLPSDVSTSNVQVEPLRRDYSKLLPRNGAGAACICLGRSEPHGGNGEATPISDACSHTSTYKLIKDSARRLCGSPDVSYLV